jgi:predicted O-methyltransferase YrrM
MDPNLRQLLDELHTYGVAHDADRPDRLDRLRNVEPDTAALLALQVRATAARKVLELGTSNGYSTLWLADAVRDTDGHVLTVELDPERSGQAAANLERAGLRGYVDLIVQDAGDALRQSADAEWDLIFLDAERPYYAGYWPDLVRVLRPGGLLVVDNVISHADQVAEFRALVSADERVSEALVATGAGALFVLADLR